MIKVWTDAAEAGLLDRYAERGSTFAYLPDAPAGRAVSITMPVRLPSWSVPFGLPPIFEMNLPEGSLRERLRLAFAKATGTFDEFDLLSIVGRSQVGRIRYTGDKEQLHEDVPFQSVGEILERKRGLDVPPYRLAEDGMALVIDRFDLRMDGTHRGFEDFCALNARRTDEKYRGSYETQVMKRFAQFANSTHVNEDLERLFVQGEARLAPAYDLVTTSVYLPKDSLALTLHSSTAWPAAKALRRLGETRAAVRPRGSGKFWSASQKRFGKLQSKFAPIRRSTSLCG